MICFSISESGNRIVSILKNTALPYCLKLSFNSYKEDIKLTFNYKFSLLKFISQKIKHVLSINVEHRVL